MGVDAGIFARKAKKYYWYDRDYNLSGHMQEHVADDLALKCEDIKWRLYNREDKVTSQEVAFLATVNAVAWRNGEESERSREGWAVAIRQFAEAFPDDEFFIATDSNDAYEFIGEMHGKCECWDGEYMEWKPKEEE